ncbi:hypothetical protein N7461_002352 [Penicillium sp. DV-2018c]|nr:hypothetical protein N7461_002352 [Penicillium sp. DV-2018c]
MSNLEPTPSEWQTRFQKMCLAFVAEVESLAEYIRDNEDARGTGHRSRVYDRLMRLWENVEKLRNAGLDMVAESPKCPLVLAKLSYWHIRDLADQTDFEEECDELETVLDQWAKGVLANEVENLWVAGFLESLSLNILGHFQAAGCLFF